MFSFYHPYQPVVEVGPGKKWGLPSDFVRRSALFLIKMDCENRWLYPFFVSLDFHHGLLSHPRLPGKPAGFQETIRVLPAQQADRIAPPTDYEPTGTLTRRNVGW